MKTKPINRWIGILCILMMGCWNEYRTEENDIISLYRFSDATNEEVEDAKYWYHLYTSEVLPVRSEEEHPLFQEAVPDWSLVISGENETCSTVEIFLGIRGQKLFLTEEIEKAWQETGDLQYLQMSTRMVILKDFATQKAFIFYMTLIPSRKYLETTGFAPFQNSYTERDPNLDGYVLYHSLDGKLVNGWVYEDGEATREILAPSDSVPVTRITRMVCVAHYIGTCADYYYSVNYGPLKYNGTVCSNFEYNGQECWYEQDEMDLPGGGGPAGTPRGMIASEGIPGGGLGLDQHAKPLVFTGELSALFTGNLLSEKGVHLLETAFNEMITDCIYRQIVDFLKQNPKFGFVRINKDMLGMASVSLKGKYLSFAEESSTAINVKNLKHEFYHMACIRYNKNTDIHQEDGGLMEFEQQLFADICHYMEIEGKIDDNKTQEWGVWSNSGKKGAELYKKEYTQWLKDLTKTATVYPTSIKPEDFKKWSVIFGEVNEKYNINKGYIYGRNWVPTIPCIADLVNKNCPKK